MKKHFLAVGLILSGCGSGGGGGGGGPAPANPNPANLPAADQLGLTSDYHDVRNIADSKPLKVGQWPSELDPTKTLAACAEGQSLFNDVCWESLSINLDNGSVTFKNNDGSQLLSLGSELSDVRSTSWKDQKFSRDEFKCYLPYDIDQSIGFTQFVGTRCDAAVGVPDTFSLAPRVWPGLSPLGVPTSNTPWAVAPSIFTDRGTTKISGFGVKTTFVYGYSPTKTQTFNVVHNWHYNGEVIVGGKSYPLPITIDQISSFDNTNTYDANTVRIKTPTSFVILNSDEEVYLARKMWGNTKNIYHEGKRTVTNITFSALTEAP